jgi:hypothetical protein
MRLWMSIPTSQPLPPKWAEYWGDVRAGSVRGGFRGSFITPQSLAHENRQAETTKTKFTPWKPLLKQEDMTKILAAKN